MDAIQWFSMRFNRPVVLTRHAQARMVERVVTVPMVADLIESGTVKTKDERNLWISKAFPEREDNLICAAVALEHAVVVKTIMHNWQLVEEP
ncbi:MAG: hypothetical protein HQM04_17860 [Magnetococcales bacterium]|nr:hypothetical protein [Magnetococcales bacterium]MBF0116895.1 hypothetical protein [Magnetococcales bacterium]